MDRRHIYLATVLFLITLGFTRAEPSPSPTPPQQQACPEQNSVPNKEPAPDLRNLSPDQRERFRKNLEIWKQMPPEGRDKLRRSAEWRKAAMRNEALQLAKELSVQLNTEQQEQFIRRYIEERRKIEQHLREEMEAKRRPLLNEMGQRLQKEFASPAPTPAPSGS